MTSFYFIALIPIAIGGYLYYKNKEVVWQEWLIGSSSAFLLAGILHLCAYFGLTSDYETWSGEIVKVEYHPSWVEEYEEMHTESYPCGTDSDGNTVYCTRTYYTTEHDRHPEHWEAVRNFGEYSDRRDINKQFYIKVLSEFGGEIYLDGKQDYHHGGDFDGGDNNVYSTDNKTGYIEPCTISFRFENKIKAAPSVFSFSEVPKDIKVFDYPNNEDWNKSDRLFGTACVLLDLYKWDCMNSYVGPVKWCNVIMIGFGQYGSEYGKWQQAKWIGGKKNDLVICFGGGASNKPADWSYVFGWTEREIVKRNIETILLEHPINDTIISYIQDEIYKNYEIKDWSKFDYISIPAPSWAYWTFIILLTITQTGLYIFFHKNGGMSNNIKQSCYAGFGSYGSLSTRAKHSIKRSCYVGRNRKDVK